jgi:hypothetical protein
MSFSVLSSEPSTSFKLPEFPLRINIFDSSNSSYSRGRDQEDRSSKPDWANISQDPISKLLNTKKGWWNGVAQVVQYMTTMGEGPEFKPKYHK